eukprot:71244-Pyramimonas_sp.AAC.1
MQTKIVDRDRTGRGVARLLKSIFYSHGPRGVARQQFQLDQIQSRPAPRSRAIRYIQQDTVTHRCNGA